MTDRYAVEIRPAREDDLPALVDIFNHYVLNTHITFEVEPHTVESRRDWFEGFAQDGRYRLFVADNGGGIDGYCHSTRFRPKAAYETSVEATVYLKPGVEGRGLGRQLYARLFDVLRGEDVHRVYGGIAQPNEASNALHLKLGFREAGHFREVGRKFGRFYDVTWFELDL